MPFSVVLEAMIGKEIFPMTDSKDDGDMLQILANSCIQIVSDSTQNPITANRQNDVSNEVEKRLQNKQKAVTNCLSLSLDHRF